MGREFLSLVSHKLCKMSRKKKTGEFQRKMLVSKRDASLYFKSKLGGKVENTCSVILRTCSNWYLPR